MDNNFILRAFPDTNEDRYIGRALLAVAIFVALLGFWASVAKVPEVAKTRGEIIPQGGDIQVVQSLSGGKLLQVYVSEGDVVEKGQSIASLDQTVSEADVKQLEVQRADYMLRIERLSALVHDRAPEFAADGKQYPGLADQQQRLYDSEKSLLAAKLGQIDDRINAKKAELNSLESQLKLSSEQVSVIQREVDIFQSAADKGVSSKRELLEKKERLSELKRIQEELTGRKKSLVESLSALAKEGESETLKTNTDHRTRRSELVEKLQEVEQELIQAHTALGQNALVAPIAGVIKALPNANVGAVIQPGGVVAELVPSDQPLDVEVRVSPRDIGFIKVGQQVLVKVDAYDYSRFGAIKGEVARVSPSTFKDPQNGQAYFKATIKPQSEFVGDEAKGRRIKVGMTAEADITTGQKTIFQYLLKPVYTTVDTALSER
ncbi:HlyD family type I secretion periplasmic adaptor subunit [Oceanicoccus sagamiensis]|uniref:Membrane fusion protein (MFP) family protein n=1 Tax=Oceanicoccus sagamiensis TaxID=716816 RepID=A0A1X9ND97_9GAMM|nr:HlyD family type I secretion periplasmic adaptor subunit [Oceanicoccus sagamiensis]ARN74372.1 hypothetical protein BST96_09705 [Oceanicoccus sagamiensis]